MVIDYRELNKLTIPLPYPFPNIWDLLLELNHSTIFTQLDLKSGYYQIKMNLKDAYKTSFVINGQQYEFLRMPFGLTNAPRTFQMAMKTMLGQLTYVKIFLDDVLIHSKDLTDHVKHVETVLQIFNENGVSINFSKSVFGESQVKYLGHIIDKNGIKSDTSKIDKLKAIQLPPKSIKELRAILGLLNWFRPYLYNLSAKISTLTDKLRGHEFRRWNNNDNEIVKSLIQCIQANIKLHHPDFTKEFQLFTDASNTGISAVLTQDMKIIGICSHKLNQSERNYSIVEKECYAIIRGMKHFKNIVFNNYIKIFTDNRNLTFNKELLSSRFQRWKLILEEYNYELCFIENKQNILADFFSRNYIITRPKTITTSCTNGKLLDTLLKKILTLKYDNSKEVEDKRIVVSHQELEPIVKYMHSFLGHPGITRTMRP